jgi:organic radical activating enzyme
MEAKTIPIVRQNIDRVVRKNDYEPFVDQLLVTSFFRTIQGEGPYAGYPSLFLRLSGCNFGNKDPNSACQWCDTAFQFDQGKPWLYKDLLDELTSDTIGYNKNDVLVITGGEPTLQRNLLPFMKLARKKFKVIQIETNGTQAGFYKEMAQWNATGELEVMLDARSRGIYSVVSPKAVYKAGAIPRPSDAVLEQAGCLKFVIDADPESPHHKVPDWINDPDLELIPVYVSPMARYLRAYSGEVSSIWDDSLIDRELTAKNYEYAAQYAIKNNYRLSLQTHLFTAIP